LGGPPNKPRLGWASDGAPLAPPKHGLNLGGASAGGPRGWAHTFGAVSWIGAGGAGEAQISVKQFGGAGTIAGEFGEAGAGWSRLLGREKNGPGRRGAGAGGPGARPGPRRPGFRAARNVVFGLVGKPVIVGGGVHQSTGISLGRGALKVRPATFNGCCHWGTNRLFSRPAFPPLVPPLALGWPACRGFAWGPNWRHWGGGMGFTPPGEGGTPAGHPAGAGVAGCWAGGRGVIFGGVLCSLLVSAAGFGAFRAGGQDSCRVFFYWADLRDWGIFWNRFLLLHDGTLINLKKGARPDREGWCGIFFQDWSRWPRGGPLHPVLPWNNRG